MARSFKYRVSGSHPNVEVQLTQVLWRRLAKALTWSVVFLLAAYCTIHFFGANFFSVSISVICLLLAAAGLLVFNWSAAWNTFWIGADTLSWREVRPFSYRKRSFLIWTVRDFGGAIYSHGGPALRLDVDGEWYLLAELKEECEAEDLLSAIKEHGAPFPPSSSDRKRQTDTFTPRFTMLD